LIVICEERSDEAIQGDEEELDCFVARAPRNDEFERCEQTLHVIASFAKQSRATQQDGLLRRTLSSQ
jgi:hypothetical protein